MDQKKEQAKVREKILKIFRARAQSPGGGPAIIVNEESHQPRRKGARLHHIKDDEFPKHKLNESDDFLLSDGNATPVDTMVKRKSKKDKHLPAEQTQRFSAKQESQVKNHNHGHLSHHKKSQQRERRRKSRAERNKHRAQTQQQVNPHEREEFRKHVKKAREITSQSRLNESHSDDQVFVAITQNRLTRQAGIYNKGKKSSRLFRDPLHVSERVTTAVENDVRMIVDQKQSDDLERPSGIESLPVVTSTPLMPDRKTNSDSTGCTRSHRRNKTSDSGTAKESCPNSTKCHSSVEQPTKKLDMQDLSSQLMSSLNVRQLFPGKDYAVEIKSELQKLMKSNCSRKDEIISAKSVRQCLESSSPKHSSEGKSVLQLTDQSKGFKRTPMSYLARTRISHATACVQVGSGSVHHSQDEVMLMEVPEATDGNQPKSKHIDHNEDSQAGSTIAKIAVHSPQLAGGTCPQQKPSQLRDLTPSVSTHVMDIGHTKDQLHEPYSTEYSSSQSFYVRNAVDKTRYDYVRVHKPSYDDICEDIFSDNVRSKRYKFTEDHGTGYSRYSLLRNKGPSTDILDHIELEQMEVAGPSPSLPDLFECCNTSMETERCTERHHRRLTRPFQHHKPHTISQFKKCESDSESSPVWYPSFDISPIKKPELDSPSPPEFYPRRMF